MIYELVRRDPAWKLAPMMAVCVAAVGAIFGLDIAMLSVPLVYFFTFNTVWPHQRAMPFLAALPIATRTIFAARVTAVLSMLWLQLAAGSAAAMLVHGPASREQAGAALAFGLFFTMVAIWVLTVRVEQCGGWSWLSLPAWCVSLVMPGVVLAGPWVAGTIGVIGLLGGAARFAWAWHKIPAGFQSAPYRAVVEKAESTKTGRAFAWRPLLGSMLNWYYLLFAVVAMPVCLLGGVPLHLAPFLLPAYSMARRRLRWLPGCGLPFSSRTLMAMMVLPLLLISVAGYATIAVLLHGADTRRVPEISSALFFELNSPITPVVTVQQDPADTSTLNVTVPFEYWSIAIGGIPQIRAPWGESARPTELRLWPFTIYNPYSVGTQNTSRFQDWQFARATKVAYGRSLSPDECEAGTEMPIPARPPAQILSFSLLVSYTVLLAWLLELADDFRRVRRVVYEGVLIAALLWPAIAVDVFGVTHGYGSVTEPLFKKLLLADLRRPAVLGHHRRLPGDGRHTLLVSGRPVPWKGDRGTHTAGQRMGLLGSPPQALNRPPCKMALYYPLHSEQLRYSR